jgi:hypothetical protein
MKRAKLLTTTILVAAAFSILPILATPAFAAESISCPTGSVGVPYPAGTTITCTASWGAGTGAGQTASVGCEPGHVCTGWTESVTWSGAPTPFGTGMSSGSEVLTITLHSPSPAACTAASDCSTEIQVETSGGGFGVVAASATVTVSTPQFAVGVATVVAVGMVAMVGLRRRNLKATPVATFG